MGRAGRLTALAALAATLPALAAAECRTATTGARCVVPGERAAAGPAPGRWIAVEPTTPRFAPGDVLPPGRYLRLLNSGYYGLPPVEDGWRYYEVEGRVLRVRPDTLEVIEDATAETNGAF